MARLPAIPSPDDFCPDCGELACCCERWPEEAMDDWDWAAELEERALMAAEDRMRNDEP